MRSTARMPIVVKRTLAGRIMLGIGTVGVVVSIAGTVVGLGLLAELDKALEGSIGLTAPVVDALGSTGELAEETVVVLERSLQQTESTTRDLGAAFRHAETVLGTTADLTEGRIAGALEAVEQTMPALVEAGALIDRTLSALDALPFGPDYDPPQPFDVSLRALQREMAGLPAALREQAVLIREGRESLGTVRQGTVAIADDLEALHATIGPALDVLRDYSDRATRARDLSGGRGSTLGQQLTMARFLVVVLGATLLFGQLVPLGIGWLLLNRQAAAAFFAESGA